MRWSKAKSAPREFVRWCRENAPVDDHGWDDLTGDAKDALRQRLAQDQSGLCVYCLVKLGPETKIEHVVPQALTTRFDWNNLALCCPGRTDDEDHCDTAKGDRDLAWVHPYRRPVVDCVRLHLNGRVAPMESARADVDEVLRLNHAGLRRRREGVLRAVLDERFGPGPLRRTLEDLQSRREPVAYQPLIEGWIERRLRL